MKTYLFILICNVYQVLVPISYTSYQPGRFSIEVFLFCFFPKTLGNCLQQGSPIHWATVLGHSPLLGCNLFRTRPHRWQASTCAQAAAILPLWWPLALTCKAPLARAAMTFPSTQSSPCASGGCLALPCEASLGAARARACLCTRKQYPLPPHTPGCQAKKVGDCWSRFLLWK